MTDWITVDQKDHIWGKSTREVVRFQQLPKEPFNEFEQAFWQSYVDIRNEFAQGGRVREDEVVQALAQMWHMGKAKAGAVLKGCRVKLENSRYY